MTKLTPALEYHAQHKGKYGITPLMPLDTREDLSKAYTPGVAEACLAIKDNPKDVYTYTSKGHTIAVVSDGSAILGLGNIGPEAGIPVMEGKALLFKKFAGLDAVPLCINTQDSEEIIRFCELIAPNYAGINLEDISFPRCLYIESTLRQKLNIPVFHDDQRGTAVCVSAALLNALRYVKKDIKSVQITMSGMGAAGSAIARMLHGLGAKPIKAFNKQGVISYDNPALDPHVKVMIDQGILASSDYNPNDNTLASVVKDGDVFIGVSVGNCLNHDIVNTMADQPIIFAMANPTPELSPSEAKLSKAAIYATGRSDLPNQINNVLVFPGIFRGAIDAHATDINEEMCYNAAYALSGCIKEEELSSTNIIPSVFDSRVVEVVSSAVYKTARKEQ